MRIANDIGLYNKRNIHQDVPKVNPSLSITQDSPELAWFSQLRMSLREQCPRREIQLSVSPNVSAVQRRIAGRGHCAATIMPLRARLVKGAVYGMLEVAVPTLDPTPLV